MNTEKHIDPVHETDDGTWWFWDETWGHRQGPFDTEKEAKEKLEKYCKELNYSEPDIIYCTKV